MVGRTIKKWWPIFVLPTFAAFVIGSHGVSFRNLEISNWFLNTLKGFEEERLDPNLIVSDSLSSESKVRS